MRTILGAALAAATLTMPVTGFAQGSKPPAQVTVTNARSVPLTSLEIATGGEPARLVAKLSKPLAPGKSATLKLTKPAGCAYTVAARFDDEVESDGEPMDLCRDRRIRLTE